MSDLAITLATPVGRAVGPPSDRSLSPALPAILAFGGIGVFSLNNTEFDVYVMALFGLLGYVFAKLECEPAPMLLGFILGPMMEDYPRRAMLLSRGDPLVLVQRPIRAVILLVAGVALLIVVGPAIRSKREEAFQES
jgi:putative tricarboxylic transport membrane protein